MFSLIKKFYLPIIATALTLPAHAAPDPRRPLVDSTGVKPAVVSTLVIPFPSAGLTEANVTSILENYQYVNGGASTIPPGYKEVSVAMGPHSIGDGSAAYGLGYYTGLGYSIYGFPSGYSGSTDPCQGNLTSPQRIVGSPGGESCTGGDSTSCSPVPASYWVCEPVGTRTGLQKVVGSTILNVTRAMLDTRTISPAIGMSTNGATAFCQALGYTNYVPGTPASTQPGTCDQLITRWNGSSFYNDDACYNPVLQSMQCYK